MAQVGIIMGSESDLPVMQAAIDLLIELNISYEVDIVSAHRTPEKMMHYGKEAHQRGIKVIIARRKISFRASGLSCRSIEYA